MANETNPLAISTQKTDGQQDSIRALAVWVQLAELFGKSFYREHGDEPTNLWVQATSRLTDQELQRGLVNLADDCLEFPANLSQFVAACKRLPPVRHLGVKYIEDQRKSGKMSRKEWMEKNG